MIEILAFFRIIAYILVIMASVSMMRVRSCKCMALGSVLMATSLLYNALLQFHGNISSTFDMRFVFLNASAFAWALSSVLQMTRA